MKDKFITVATSSSNVALAEYIDLDIANSNARYARSGSFEVTEPDGNGGNAVATRSKPLKKISEISDYIKEAMSQRGVSIIGAGPSLGETNEHGQTLLQQAEESSKYKILTSMTTRILKEGGLTGADAAVFGCFSSERVSAMKQGGAGLIDKIKDSGLKLLVPTYV